MGMLLDISEPFDLRHIFPSSTPENKDFLYWMDISERGRFEVYICFPTEVGKIYINFGILKHVFNLGGCIIFFFC